MDAKIAKRLLNMQYGVKVLNPHKIVLAYVDTDSVRRKMYDVMTLYPLPMIQFTRRTRKYYLVADRFYKVHMKRREKQ
jgi:hypothetical protein